MSEPRDQLAAEAARLGIGSYRRHVLLCTGPTCCSAEQGTVAWEALKSAIKEQGLAGGDKACYRTKVGCLRVCAAGPVAVVYPDGTWYHGLVAERVPRFVREHLVEDRPIEDWIFARNPLADSLK
jgi:(2Fe-2S) ferredoxin